MSDDRPLLNPIPNVPLSEFPQSNELPEGCEILEGLVDDDLFQVEYHEAVYVTRTLADGTACPHKLYVLVPSAKDPIKATYGEGGYPCVVFCQGSAWHKQHLYGHFADHVRLAQNESDLDNACIIGFFGHTKDKFNRGGRFDSFETFRAKLNACIVYWNTRHHQV